jgi:hypothetical protein
MDVLDTSPWFFKHVPMEQQAVLGKSHALTMKCGIHLSCIAIASPTTVTEARLNVYFPAVLLTRKDFTLHDCLEVSLCSVYDGPAKRS